MARRQHGALRARLYSLLLLVPLARPALGALLANVGYDRPAGRAIPSIFGLTQIMYLPWFANCLAFARLGDVYRGYLLKKEANVSFAVTLGTVLAERLLDLLVVATMIGVGVFIILDGTTLYLAAQP